MQVNFQKQPFSVIAKLMFLCGRKNSCALFCLVFSPNIYKFLNQEEFSRWIKIVLFSVKKKKVKNEFLLRMIKIICHWGKQNNLISNRKQDYFVYPIGRLFCLFQGKNHLILTFFWKQDNFFFFLSFIYLYSTFIHNLELTKVLYKAT